MRALRGISGVVAAGVVVLGVVVVLAAVLAARRSVQGPGTAEVVAHVVAAVVVVVAQRSADRQHRGPKVVLDLIVVLVVGAALLWTQWLA